MARNKVRLIGSTVASSNWGFERLEARTLLSATTPEVLGYLPDYEISSSLMRTLITSKFEGLTQVNYFSVDPTTTGLLPGTTVGGVSNNSNQTSGGYGLSGSSSQLATLVADAHAVGVKVDITIGGGGSQSNTLTNVVEAGAATWATFAASVQQFATAHGVDGVDLDWEPSSLGSSDQADYGGLIATLKANTTGLTLSAAVNSERLQLDSGGSAYVLNAIGVKDLTTINVMAYDLEAGNTSPIALAESNLAGWGKYVLTSGGAKTQLIFGMPFYGTSGTTWANTQADQYSQLINGYGSLPSPSADSVVINGTTWNYNGPNTIYNKTAYSLDNGYGGVLAWEIGQDYFPSGGGYDSTYSLLPQFGKAVTSNTGTISGTVLTASATSVAGETVYLDTNNNGAFDAGEPTTTTSSSGQYSFSDLLIGTYSVGEVLPTGYTQTTPASGNAISAVITAGGTVTANFTVAPAQASTALALIDNGPSTSDATQSLSFTANLTGGVPDGQTVTLEDASNNNAPVATATLTGGSATFTISAGALAAGTHSLFAVYSGNVSYAPSESNSLSQTVQVVVTAVTVNGNIAALAGAQRSMVDSVVYSFSEPVSLGSSAFSIALHPGQTGTLPTLTWTALNPAADGSSASWAVTFSGAGVIGKSIADGVYDLSLNNSAVTSDSNPTVTAQPAATFTFDRLFGDINGDGVVNLGDYGRIAKAVGTTTGNANYVAALDYDGGGAINLLDYGQFAKRYGMRFTF